MRLFLCRAAWRCFCLPLAECDSEAFLSTNFALFRRLALREMAKNKKVLSKEESAESVEYPSGELKVRKKGSKLGNGSGKKEEAAGAASKKAAVKKRARKPASRNFWVVGFLSFLTAAVASALIVYNWSLHDDFDLSRFWADNEAKISAIVEQVAALFAQQLNGTNPALPPPEAAPPTAAPVGA